MSNNLEKKIYSCYIKKLENNEFEVRHFETLKQRQEYLLKNDELTARYIGKVEYVKHSKIDEIKNRFYSRDLI